MLYFPILESVQLRIVRVPKSWTANLPPCLRQLDFTLCSLINPSAFQGMILTCMHGGMNAKNVETLANNLKNNMVRFRVMVWKKFCTEHDVHL